MRFIVHYTETSHRKMVVDAESHDALIDLLREPYENDEIAMAMDASSEFDGGLDMESFEIFAVPA